MGVLAYATSEICTVQRLILQRAESSLTNAAASSSRLIECYLECACWNEGSQWTELCLSHAVLPRSGWSMYGFGLVELQLSFQFNSLNANKVRLKSLLPDQWFLIYLIFDIIYRLLFLGHWCGYYWRKKALVGETSCKVIKATHQTKQYSSNYGLSTYIQLVQAIVCRQAYQRYTRAKKKGSFVTSIFNIFM